MINGTYFDRLLVNVLPWTLLGYFIIYLATGHFTIIPFLLFTIALWILDTLIIFFKFRPKSLKIKKGLFLGKKQIDIKTIVSITPILDKRYRWSFRMLQFMLGSGEEIMVIDKPQFIISDMLNKPSGTLKKLFTVHPELKSKLQSLKSI